jgi:hypothetical protein
MEEIQTTKEHPVLLTSLTLSKAAFTKGTGWQIRPEGACKGDTCIPLPPAQGDNLDVIQVAEAMGLPLAHEPAHQLWSLGPQSIGHRALLTAQAPELELPDLSGKLFNLKSLLGRKVLLYAWAPY